MLSINPQARISLPELRTKIQAIKRFTLTEEELKRASPAVRCSMKKLGDGDGQKQPTLTPGATHTLVARQITNLTEDDIERLEAEAREDAREASIRVEHKHGSLFADAIFNNDDGDEEDEGDCPLFLTPTFSPTPTIIVRESTSRASNHATLNVEPNFVLGDDDSDVDSDLDAEDADSDTDSDALITPPSRPIADEDVDVEAVPEIHLDGGYQPYEINMPILSLKETQSSSLMMKAEQDAQIEAPRRAKRSWWL